MMLNYNMLTYSKSILSKVSFNKYLLKKELNKTMAFLAPQEIYTLKSWCYKKYGNKHKCMLIKIFLHEKLASTCNVNLTLIKKL